MKATMGKAVRPLVVGEGLTLLKRQFEQWRAWRAVGQRIPAQLWDGAVGAAAECGAYRVARELNLDYAMLKQRVARRAADAPSGTPAAPRFVELFAPSATAALRPQAAQPECVVELANARGATMRLELRGSALAGLPALCSAFWGA